MNEYRIEKVDDFRHIPLDRLDDCLSEFKSMLMMISYMKGGVVPYFRWIDDGRRDKTIRFIKRIKPPALYPIEQELVDEDGNHGIVVIRWNDGDICELENDAAHQNPRQEEP